MTNEEVFKVFLKKHKCLMKYRANLCRTDTAVSKNPLTCKAVLSSFNWKNSNEGEAIWRDLHAEWDKMCEHFDLKDRIKLREV